MTEAEWLACGDPRKLWRSLRGGTSDRQMCLVACALFRAMQRHGLRPDERNLRLSLARAARDERLPDGSLDPLRLAVLAALLEPNCDNAEMLGHPRSPGLHVRGCRAADLLLGKA